MAQVAVGQDSGAPRFNHVAAATAAKPASDPLQGSLSSGSITTSMEGVSVARTTSNDRTVRSWTVPSSSTTSDSDVTQLQAMWAAPTQ